MSIFAEIKEKFSPLTMDTFANNKKKREDYIKASQAGIVEKISSVLTSCLPVMPYNTKSVILDISEITYRENALIASITLTYSESISQPIYCKKNLFTFNGNLGNDDKGSVDFISAHNFEKGYIYISDHPEFGEIKLNELFDDGFSLTLPTSTK